jgi:putative secretion ATPase (PEP-CTERM system associated)
MYAEFYGLAELPFQLAPNARFFFDSEVHARALSYLTYGLHKGEGFIVVTGEVGAGKTILLDRLLSTLDDTDYRVSHITTTLLTPDDLLRLIARGFGIAGEELSKAALLERLESTLNELRRSGVRTLVVVDEVQNLPLPALEELRMLSNLATDGVPLMQILLVGQTQFRNMLDRGELEQLQQRVVATYRLRPLAAEEIRNYVEHRLACAGWRGDPAIAPGIYEHVYRATGGLPRRINILMDRLMLFACLEESNTIKATYAEQVIAELQDEGLFPVVRSAAV